MIINSAPTIVTPPTTFSALCGTKSIFQITGGIDPDGHSVSYVPSIPVGSDFIKWTANQFEIEPKEAAHCGDFTVIIGVTDTNLQTDYSITIKVAN